MSEDIDIEEVESAEEEIDVDSLPEGSFDDLIEQFEQEEGELVFPVGKGKQARKYRAQRLTNLSEKIRLTEKADSLMERCENLRKTPEDKIPEAFKAWKPFLKKPISKKAATMIIFATELLIAPKLTQLQCLRLNAKGGDALLEIAGPILEAGTKGAAEGEAELLETEKND